MGNRQVRQNRLLILGLQGAGKTSAVFNLRLGEVITTIPAVGFNVETVEHKGCFFTMFDVGGEEKFRPLMRHYFANTDGLIFIVDSNDVERLAGAGRELRNILADDDLQDSILLVFANKQDLPQSLSPQEVVERMGLLNGDGLKLRWGVFGSCACSASTLYEGLDWLAKCLAQKVPYDGPHLNADSLGVIKEPQCIVTTRHVVVFDEPGSSIRNGVLNADITLSIMEVLLPSGTCAITYGRIEVPMSGWLALHSGQVKANHYAVSLYCSLLDEEGVSVSCCNLAGEELCLLVLRPSELQEQKVADLRRIVATRSNRDQTCLRLVMSDGTCLGPEDDRKLLAAVFKDIVVHDSMASKTPWTKSCSIS